MTENGSRLETLKSHAHMGIYISAPVFASFAGLYPVSLQFTVPSTHPLSPDLLADAFPGSLRTFPSGTLLLTAPRLPTPLPYLGFSLSHCKVLPKAY